MVSTSERAPPTSCRWLRPWEQALSEFDEPAGAPGPGDACPLWPHRWVAVPCDRVAQGWRREEGEVWQCHSNRGGRRGTAASHPNGDEIVN